MKKVLSILFTVMMVLSMAACSGSPSAPASSGSTPSGSDSGNGSSDGGVTPEVTIKCAYPSTADMENPVNKTALYFEQIVEERSGGRIDIELYLASALGNARTTLEGIQLGTIEMGEVENGPIGSFIPSALIWDMPFLFKSYEHAYAVMDGELGDELAEDFLNVGIRHLGYNNGGLRHFFTNKRPANNAENMKGLKIRVMETNIMIDTINGFGASATPMAFGELYTALQQGTVDGMDMPTDMFVSQSFYEVQQYMVPSGHFFMPRHYMINEAFYQSLSPEFQELITECAKEACEYQRREMEAIDAKYMGEMANYGVEIVEDFDYDYFEPIGTALWPQYYEQIGGGDAALGEKRVNEIVALGEQFA